MRGNNVLGIIFSNTHEERLRDITDIRTMGSVPFGARYRLIDFPLSNMVNSGINKVGVITKQNYQSLMDHLGSGKAWDLSRKRDGLFILPPFGNSRLEFNNKIETLSAIRGFLVNSSEEYVLISECDVICNINYQKVVYEHIKNGADITLIYKYGDLPKNFDSACVLSLSNTGRINELYINPQIEGKCNFGINMILINRELLIKLVDDCVSRNETNFQRDIIQRCVSEYKMFGYELEGRSWIISSMDAYFTSNMELINEEAMKDLFKSKRPIYTKIRDDMPCMYGLDAKVKDSIVASGCKIEGEVNKCVLFKGVKIEKGARVENCIIMQDTVISKNSDLKYIVCDKDVVVKSGRTLIGFKSYPVYVSKASVI